MSFLTPSLLWLLIALPTLAAIYVLLQRRRKHAVVRYANLAVIKEALGTSQRVRRHLPPFLFMLAIAAMLLAIARPTAVITLPSEQRTVLLAIDVSLSMRATDVEPSRIAAAKE